MIGNWGATTAEIASPVVGDEICANPQVSATRCITITAPPSEVFPWIRQMGFSRAGWYSYDLLDNLGRRSATAINPQWQDVESGASVPGGPVKFEATIVDPPRSFVLRVVLRGWLAKKMCFTLAYELRDDAAGSRLVTRMRVRIDLPGGTFISRFILGPGDGLMVRKQLKTIASRAGR